VDHDDLCAYCNKKGHWAKECCKKKQDEVTQGHVAQGKEEEQSLLLAQCITSIINPTPVSHPSLSSVPRCIVPPTPTTLRCVVHIEEQKVFTGGRPCKMGPRHQRHQPHDWGKGHLHRARPPDLGNGQIRRRLRHQDRGSGLHHPCLLEWRSPHPHRTVFHSVTKGKHHKS
jgi:hypothetical protein